MHLVLREGPAGASRATHIYPAVLLAPAANFVSDLHISSNNSLSPAGCERVQTSAAAPSKVKPQEKQRPESSLVSKCPVVLFTILIPAAAVSQKYVLHGQSLYSSSQPDGNYSATQNIKPHY